MFRLILDGIDKIKNLAPVKTSHHLTKLLQSLGSPFSKTRNYNVERGSISPMLIWKKHVQ